MGIADLERRTITAVVYAVVVFVALMAPPPIFALLVLTLGILGYFELRNLFRYRSYRPWFVGVVFTALFVLSREYVLVWLVAFAVVAMYAFFLDHEKFHRPHPNVLAALTTVGAALYTGWLLGFLVDLWAAGPLATRGWLGALPVWLLLAIVPTWVGDSAAYLVGSRIGRRRITPTISPGKTWEGTLAGFAAAGIVALLIAVSAGMKTGPALLVAALVGPVGFAGDLFESRIKRVAGAKDSGTLFPGHGGVLDRIDSLIFVAPAVALVLALARG